MNCEACRYENPPGARFCEFCGKELGGVQRRATVAESAAPAQPRRTVVEAATPLAPRPVPGAAADVFARPGARTVLDPADPFRSAHAQPTPSAGNGRANTVVAGGAAPRRLRGVIVELRAPDDPGRLHPVYEGRNTLGRGEDNDVCIDDGRVSGQHAFVFALPERTSWLDVSTNGSHVDGRDIHGEQVPLRHGSRVRIGGSQLIYLAIPDLDGPAVSA